MLRRAVSSSYISPKADGLRLIKGYLALARSVYHVPGPTWGEVLRLLCHRSRTLRQQHEVLDRALTFLETARYLFQLLVVEKEEIDTGPAASDGLLEVAHRMGFARRGALDPAVPLLVAYYDTIDAVKEALGQVLEPIEDHLRRISCLSVLRYPELEAEGRHFNVAVRHAAEARRFLGTRYWDDLLDEMVRPGSPVAERWVDDLTALTPLRRRVVLKTLVEWGVRDLASFGRLLIPLRHRAEADGREELFDEAVDLFLDRCAEEPRMAESLASLLTLWPVAVDHFLSLLDAAQLGRLGRLAAAPVDDAELVRPARVLGLLILIRRRASPWLLDSFRAATRHHPEALSMLDDPSELGLLADTLYGQAEGLSDLFSGREWLDAYANLLAVRLGLELLGGEPYHRVLRRYRRGMHVLLRSLYFMCRRELEELYRVGRSRRHLACILVEAGCRGFHPFERRLKVRMMRFDDHDGEDDGDDGETSRFFTEVAAMFAEELSQLGLSPSRLEPVRPRELVASFDAALELEPDNARAQLDRVQMLRLGRVVGTFGNLERFNQEVVGPILDPVRGRLGELMAGHIASRLVELDGLEAGALDLEEMPGGIADLERLFLVIGSARGVDPFCEDPAACCLDGPAGAALEPLRRGTAMLQVLLALRRLLRGRPGTGRSGAEVVSAAFFEDHADLVARQPELARTLEGDPLARLRELGRANLEQMARALDGTAGLPLRKG
jgi:hypothetical protein